jgi:hypothetical protein
MLFEKRNTYQWVMGISALWHGVANVDDGLKTLRLRAASGSLSGKLN